MKLNILLLCDKPKDNANTINDHICAFERYSKHNVFVYSNVGNISPKLDLDKFDAIIVHYSLSLLYDHFISPQSKARLRAYSGLKILFVQDEYRRIDNMVEQIKYINFDVLFTCFPDTEIEKIYPKTKLPTLTKYNNLTGYIPEKLVQIKNVKTISEREIDVGYRSREIPFYLGQLAYEKWAIVEKWKEHTSCEDLKVDISNHEGDRLYGEKWVNFLSSCKTTLGAESGSSVMDFTGELEQKITLHQLANPHDSFEEVQKKYLLEHEGKYKLNQISPRCFEAIALKTVLVLYEGEYSGILIPGRHYIELKKDFSNIDKVLALIRDDTFLQEMADIAYEEIACNPTYHYRSFIEHVDRVIRDEFALRAKKKVKIKYGKAAYQRAINHVPLKKKLGKIGVSNYLKLPSPMRRIIKGVFKPKLAINYIKRKFCTVLPPAKSE